MLFWERREERSWKTGSRKITIPNQKIGNSKNKASEIYPQFCWEGVFLSLFFQLPFFLFALANIVILILSLLVPWLHFCIILTVSSKRLAGNASCSPQEQRQLMFPDLASSPVSPRLLCEARLHSPHPLPRPDPQRAKTWENAANAESVSWHYFPYPCWELWSVWSYSSAYAW